VSQNEHYSGQDSPIETPKQVITVLAITFLLPFVIVVLVLQFMANIRSIDMDSPAMTHDAVAKRLQPVGDVAFADSGSAAAAPEAQAGAGPAATAVKADGKKIYDAGCSACHGAGLVGAPKAGDKTAWTPRLATGMDALYASALKGKGVMPAKGGNAALADAEVKAAVDYLAALAK
jgi:cytochrome c5